MGGGSGDGGLGDGGLVRRCFNSLSGVFWEKQICTQVLKQHNDGETISNVILKKNEIFFKKKLFFQG